MTCYISCAPLIGTRGSRTPVRRQSGLGCGPGRVSAKKNTLTDELLCYSVRSSTCRVGSWGGVLGVVKGFFNPIQNEFFDLKDVILLQDPQIASHASYRQWYIQSNYTARWLPER